MTEFTPLAGLAGGILIGFGAVLLMASHGRIMGASGIFDGLFTLQNTPEFRWRAAFIAGLLLGALAVRAALGPAIADATFAGGPLLLAVSGLIVGIGVTIGSGCTSGHGICGLARLSPRSLVATCTFMAAAIATVFFTRHVIGG